MKRPVRLQLSRRKGFDLQAVSKRLNRLPATVVSRPTRWSNPWRMGVRESGQIIERREALKHYGVFIRGKHAAIRRELEGKNLACWCSLDVACHADILLRIANAPGRKGKSAAKNKPNQNQQRDGHPQNP
jgi:hypothetical protein